MTRRLASNVILFWSYNDAGYLVKYTDPVLGLGQN